MIRQWRVLQLLERHSQGLRVREIWEALGRITVERTVFRDLEDLQAAGFALVKDEDGRWRLLRPSGAGYSIPVQATELIAVNLAAEALGSAAGSPLWDALQGLADKLSAMLTPIGRQFVDEMRATVVASHVLPGRAELVSEAAECVHEAIHKQQVLRMRYRSPRTGLSEREFAPYTHWCIDGRAYVIGYCYLRQAIRRLLIARIEHIELTDRTFDPDPAFDPREHIARGFGVWLGEPHDVELLFGADAAHLAHERRFHPEQRVAELPDGSVRLEMNIAGLPTLARWIAGTGGAVRVLKPRMLVDMVREIHQAGLDAATIKPPARAQPSPASEQSAAGDD